jgi:hypothetical protein
MSAIARRPEARDSEREDVEAFPMATSAQQARLDEILSRADGLLYQRLKREEEEQARADASLEEARRKRQRANAEARRLIAETYDDAFASFGVEVPMAVDDEAPSAYRSRLFNRLARRLPPGHELADIRADSISHEQVVFDNFERMLLRAAMAEGKTPSHANLPDDGTLIARNRVDSETGEKHVWYGRESFIKDIGRPGHRVLRIIDPKTRSMLFGAPLDRV